LQHIFYIFAAKILKTEQSELIDIFENEHYINNSKVKSKNSKVKVVYCP